MTPVSTITHKAGKLIAFKYGVTNMAITPDGKTLYVFGFSWYTPSNTVIPVSTATGKIGKPITWQPGAGWGAAVLMTPNGKTLYIASTLGTVTPISTATDKAGKPITFGSEAMDGAVYMAITPDGKTLYAFASGPYGPGNTVTPISTATNKAGKPITVGQWSAAIVVSPNGKMVYVASTGSHPTGRHHPVAAVQRPAGAAQVRSGYRDADQHRHQQARQADHPGTHRLRRPHHGDHAQRQDRLRRSLPGL